MIFKRLAKDTVVYGTGEMLGRLVTFVSFPIIATVLSTESFGILDLILTSSTLLGLFIGCGLSNALSIYYWDEKINVADQPLLVSTGLFLQIIFGGAFIVIGLVLSPYIFSELKAEYDIPFSITALLSVIILIPILQWLQYVRDIIRLHLAPWRFTFMSVFVKSLSAILGVAAVVYYKAGIDGFLLAQLASLLIALPLAIWFIKKDIVFKFSAKFAKEILQFGVPFIYVGVAYWIFGSVDRWMLASMDSVKETGIYSIASRFASIVLFLSMAFGQAWSPNAVKIKTDNPKNYKDIFAKVFLLLLYVMLITGGSIALLSKEIIHIVLPGQYAAAAMPMAILCFSIIIQSTQQITAVGISLERKTKIFGYMAWVTAFINIGLNYVLIPHWGASGAATATLVSYIVLTMSYIYFTQRLHPLPFCVKKISWLIFLGSILGTVIYTTDSFLFSWLLVGVKLFILIVVALLGASIFKKDILAIRRKNLLGN